MPTVIFLNNNKYMVPGAKNRGPEFSRVLASGFLDVRDCACISSRARALADVYPSLSRPARQELLHPSVFPVFLGVKDSYIQYTNDPYTEQLGHEVCAIPRIGQQFGLFFTDAYIVNIPSFKQRLVREGDLLSANGCMSPDQLDYFRNRPVDGAWVDRLHPVLQRFVRQSIERHYFHGFLLGYPAEDIEYAARMERSGAISYATVVSDLFGNNMLSDENHTAFILLKRWETAMRYGYGLLSHFPHFWDDLDVGLSSSLSTILKNLGRFKEIIVDVRIRNKHPEN